MIFLFDVDGVCGDLVSKILTEVKEEFPESKITYEDINSDMLVPDKSVFSPTELKFVHTIMQREGFITTLSVIEECKETIDALRKNGHKIVWLTAPYYWSKTWCFDRLLWLKSNFGATENDVIFARNKFLTYGDVFVDDKPSNVDKWQRQWPFKKGFLFSQPWNQIDKVLPRATWADIRKLG